MHVVGVDGKMVMLLTPLRTRHADSRDTGRAIERNGPWFGPLGAELGQGVGWPAALPLRPGERGQAFGLLLAEGAG